MFSCWSCEILHSGDLIDQMEFDDVTENEAFLCGAPVLDRRSVSGGSIVVGHVDILGCSATMSFEMQVAEVNTYQNWCEERGEEAVGSFNEERCACDRTPVMVCFQLASRKRDRSGRMESPER